MTCSCVLFYNFIQSMVARTENWVRTELTLSLKSMWSWRSNFNPKKIVTFKSQNLTDIPSSNWFSKSFLNCVLKTPYNVWGSMTISEKQICDHLRVKFRLIIAPSNTAITSASHQLMTSFLYKSVLYQFDPKSTQTL